MDPFKEYRPQSSDPGSTLGFTDSKKWGEAWVDGDPVGEELLARFLALLIPPMAEPDPGSMSFSWFHSMRSSGDMFCTSRRISPMSIKSFNASRPAGVVGTSFGADSGSLGCSGEALFRYSLGLPSPFFFAPPFSFSSSERRLITASAFVEFSSLGRP